MQPGAHRALPWDGPRALVRSKVGKYREGPGEAGHFRVRMKIAGNQYRIGLLGSTHDIISGGHGAAFA